jgi:DNA polymerase-1
MPRKIHPDQRQLTLGNLLDYPQKVPFREWPEGYTLNVKEYFDKYYSGLCSVSTWGLDIETVGLQAHDPNTRVLCIGLSAWTGTACCFLIDDSDECKENLKLLEKLLSAPHKMVAGHNIKFDIGFIEKKLGIKVKCHAYDTMLAQYFLDETKKYSKLETLLSERYVDLQDYKYTVNRKALQFENPNDMMLYCMKDTDGARRLCGYFIDKLGEVNLRPVMVVASQVLPIVSRMETSGLLIDKQYAKQAEVKLIGEMLSKRSDLRDLAGEPGFKPSSPESVAHILYDVLQYEPIAWTKTKQASTSYETLIRLRDEQKKTQFLETLISYKKLQKRKNTYYDPIEDWTKLDGRIHTTFNIGGTDTGRLSADSPNPMAFPRGIDYRGMVLPTPGFIFLDGDFSQIEIRIAAWLAQEESLLQMFEDDLDVHTAVMCDLFGYDYNWLMGVLGDKKHEDFQRLKNQRVGVKNFNFALLYGAWEKKLQSLLHKEGLIWSEKQCRDVKLKWESKYRNIVRWRERTESLIIRYKQIRMPFGQLRRLPGANLYSSDGRHALRQGVNFVVQSTDAWITLCGMVLLDNYFASREDLEGRILLQVHDNIMSEVRCIPYIDDIRRDVQDMMESDIKEYVRDIFKVNLDVKLKFDVAIQERWQ